jgi:hypothetical protein
VLGKDKLAEGTAMIAENLFNRGSSLMQKSGDGGAACEEGKRKALEKLSEGPGDNAARELGILLLLLKDLKTPIQEVKKSVEGSGKVNTKTLAPTDGTKKEGSPKASENNWLTSLARIGGAAALTNGASNPLVTLQKQANNLLASIDRNTRNRTTGTATFA